jgi:hypothetical protein
MLTSKRPLLGLALLCLAAAPAPNDSVDVSEIKPKLRVYTDGKQHYLVLQPFELDDFLFYGDGKTFHQLRAVGGGASGDESFDRIFWDPRVHAAYQASFGFRERKYTLLCESRKTEFKKLPEADGQKLLDGATFRAPLWKRRAYALARDNTGVYYYVDTLREPPDSKAFRLFKGPKGSMQEQKMTNVVSDSAGDVFATKTGSLRLVLNRSEQYWEQAGKTKAKLIDLPLEDNRGLIYNELGVYNGQRLGTPCDDL